MLIVSATSQVTSQIADHGAYVVFGLMALDALLPAGGELIMLYAGVLAAGAIAGHHASIFGLQPRGDGRGGRAPAPQRAPRHLSIV